MTLAQYKMKQEEKNIYTEQGFSKRLKRAIIFSVITVVQDIIISFWENIHFLEGLRTMVIVFAVLVWPIVVVAVWGRCIGYYLGLKIKKSDDRVSTAQRVWICISIVIIAFFGIKIYSAFSDLVTYVADNLNILDGLYYCVAIKTGIAAGWLFCWLCSMKLRGVISAQGKILKKLLMLVIGMILAAVLIHVTDIREEYISKYTDHVWIIRMMEYYDEHGIGPDVVPFSNL